MLKPTRSKRDRAKDPRRTLKSVRTHEAIMAAYGRSTGWERDNKTPTPHSDEHKGHYWVSSTGDTTAKCKGCGASSRVYSAKDLNRFN